MAQVKLSVAFVLVAAAIAPIVAHPIRENREFGGNVGHHLHHHHNHRHHHNVAIPEQSSLEPGSDTTPPPSPREYADEPGDMFERAYTSRGAQSLLQRLRQSQHFRPMQLGHGPVVLHPNNGPFTSHGMGFGHGPVVHRPFNGHAFPALRSGYRPGRQGFGVREYAESDMFERDFEDVEFDARDFVDELYLD